MKIGIPLKYSYCNATISLAVSPVQPQQTADILTKRLARPVFEHLISKLGMIDIYEPTFGGVESHDSLSFY